ncbi:sensor domain-containing protein [Burkholderia sp. PU8-34]
MDKPQGDDVNNSRRDRDDQNAEGFYEKVLRLSPHGVLIVDASIGCDPIVFASDVMQRMTGYDLDEICGQPFEFLFDQSEDPRGLDELRREALEFKVASIVLRTRCKDGTLFWSELSIEPVRSSAGIVTHLVAFLRDVSDAVDLRSALLWTQAGQQAIFDNSPDFVCRISDEGLFEVVGKSVTRILGWKPDELIGRSILTIVPPDRQDFVRQQLIRVRLGHVVQGSRRKYFTKHGRPVYIEWTVSRVTGGGIICIGRDVTKEVRFSSKIDYLGHWDPLTNLPNRIETIEKLSEFTKLAARGHGHLALIILNLDHFKEVNESFGHKIGDDVLRNLAIRFKRLMPNADFIGRLSGDEFAFVFGDVGARSDEVFAEKLLYSVSQPMLIGNHQIKVTASIGVARSISSTSAEALLSHASDAMKAAQIAGGSGVQRYDSAREGAKQRHLRLRVDMKGGLERNEFILHYQPKLSLSTGRVVGAEALIRWNHPLYGFVLPGEFIDIAEESSLILEFGNWVINRALRDLGSLAPMIGSDIPCSINVSPRQLADIGFSTVLAERIESFGIDPSRLEIEVTESTLMRDFNNTERVLHKIRGMGVGIALDDFGTGYSSLAYVMKLPIDTIKIDRAFVRDLDSDHDGRARTLLGTVIALCKSLSLQAIAEGVETQEQREVLLELGCDSIQGFLVSPALPLQQFADFVNVCNKSP